MSVFNNLKMLNDVTIKYLEKMNRDVSENYKIKQELSDEAFFFKINKDEAYKILNQIGIAPKKIDEIYREVISKKEFFNLYNANKIDINDEKLFIKYEIYTIDDLFKKK